MRPNDGPRAVALLASMRRFLDPKASAVHALVIVPSAELTWWRLARKPFRGGGEHGEVFFEVRVVAEDDVLPTPTARLRVAALKANQRESRGAGYRVQMLLKLAVAANHVHTDFYVTLDCDVLLAKPLKLRDARPRREGVDAGRNGRATRVSVDVAIHWTRSSVIPRARRKVRRARTGAACRR